MLDPLASPKSLRNTITNNQLLSDLKTLQNQSVSQITIPQNTTRKKQNPIPPSSTHPKNIKPVRKQQQ
jgi:hypothetical protein